MDLLDYVRRVACNHLPLFQGEKMKDHTKRPLVKKFLSWWEQYLKENGPDKTFYMLNNSKTTRLTRKDELGLMQALKLEKSQ